MKELLAWADRRSSAEPILGAPIVRKARDAAINKGS
jgi:hypothetical protein